MNYKISHKILKLRNIPIWTIGTLISIMWFMPFIWMLSTSLKLPENVITKEIVWFPDEITLGNYIRMLEFPIIRWFLNSGIQAICATTLTVISGAMAGYAFAILKFPGNKLIFLIFLTSIMIPPEVALVQRNFRWYHD